MADKEGNMRLPLTKNITLVGDGLQYWIVREVKKQDGTKYDRRESGYCHDFNNLLDSHTKKALGNSGIETLQEFIDEMKRLERLHQKWCKMIKEELGEVK